MGRLHASVALTASCPSLARTSSFQLKETGSCLKEIQQKTKKTLDGQSLLPQARAQMTTCKTHIHAHTHMHNRHTGSGIQTQTHIGQDGKGRREEP